ncbi:phosphoacetylglucosamine mutase [Nematocida sp. AWRm77]|nr:phosphoacetylglucosamine mutase [Nematocida sp. AWRm77]
MFRKEKEDKIEYGTAGYRGHHSAIYDIVDRAYAVCAIRSCSVQRPIGMVLTASHNPAEDNGIKYVDYTGNVFTPEWEDISTRVVGCSNAEIEEVLQGYALTESVVYISRDTRGSGEAMVQKCLQAAKRLGSSHKLLDIGVTTTPQMHFLIRELCRRNTTVLDTATPALGEELLLQYYRRISRFCRIVQRVYGVHAPKERVLDSSNGVGQVEYPRIRRALCGVSALSLLTNGKALNEECGSDYIKTTGRAPAGVECGKEKCTVSTQDGEKDGSVLVCAFDGDADRILYMHPGTGAVFDGDRLCLLFLSYVGHLLCAAEQSVQAVAVVTKYSNGAAMREMEKKGPLKLAQTGVKNMQAEASQHLLSVWFENNGHGTVCFSEEVKKALADRAGCSLSRPLLDLPESELDAAVDAILSSPTPSMNPPARVGSPYNEHYPPLSVQEGVLLLHALCSLMDPFIGDAVVNMCLSECIFFSGFIRPEELLGMYEEMPNVLSSVKGRKEALTDVFVQSVQEKYGSLRIHLRASGTEDLIRVYIEGESRELVHQALQEITEMLDEIK